MFLQMYRTFLSGKTSRKDVKDSTSWLFKLYYGRIGCFMGYCCISCLSYFTDPDFATLCSSGFELVRLGNQADVNVIRMKTAADICGYSWYREEAEALILTSSLV
ncbi:PREDICTED: probable CDP-diacylglycerol--inositol 3-phosphatidyltransferase 2 [Tarenaya hassleriana]|uniref:probable CDP-diacylglycerol--inositol 3-phosphatidyltransferase 2 n=1 Tax=Tarenaya hassleriana TaxID=28532 RepID=UPI00053C80E6|nr:PREDICTED: probable CDP-diacylglycerol--inositol 3-phosphatidyltransferase 2 [Tarenaya hassleriana]